MVRSIFEYILLFMYSILYNSFNYKKPMLETIATPVVKKHENIFDKNLTFYEEDDGPIWF